MDVQAVPNCPRCVGVEASREAIGRHELQVVTFAASCSIVAAAYGAAHESRVGPECDTAPEVGQVELQS
jgi:hypothetical protein